jgi:hypothetical protein
MKMKIGNLVRNAYGNLGIITKYSERSRFHVWVQWCAGDHHTIHVRNLEVLDEGR